MSDCGCGCGRITTVYKGKPRRFIQGHNPTPNSGPDPKSLEERFWQRAEKMPTGCWEWAGRRTSLGYGTMTKPKAMGGSSVYAHRFAYELLVEPIPEGLVIDHLCCNRACVNPDHLEPVTQAENVRRGNRRYFKAMTHCKRGHALSGDNLALIERGPMTERVCMACHRLRNAEYRERKRAAA